MEEREYSQREKSEFEDRLSKIRSVINSIIPKMEDFFEKTGVDKESTEFQKVYFAGGTLCLDIIAGGKDKGLVMLNISDETINIIVEGVECKRLMSISQVWFAFTVYKEVKGITEYYKNCYDKSCIRHLYSIMMNRREINSPMSAIEYYIINESLEQMSKIDFYKAIDEILK